MALLLLFRVSVTFGLLLALVGFAAECEIDWRGVVV